MNGCNWNDLVLTCVATSFRRGIEAVLRSLAKPK